MWKYIKMAVFNDDAKPAVSEIQMRLFNLYQAVSHNKLSEFEQIIGTFTKKEKAVLNQIIASSGDPLLIHAMNVARWEMIDILLKMDEIDFSQGNDGRKNKEKTRLTPLNIAINGALLEDKTASNFDDDPEAVREKYFHILERLLQKGLDPNVRNQYGYSVLDILIQCSESGRSQLPRVVKLLEDYGFRCAKFGEEYTTRLQAMLPADFILRMDEVETKTSPTRGSGDSNRSDASVKSDALTSDGQLIPSALFSTGEAGNAAQEQQLRRRLLAGNGED